MFGLGLPKADEVRFYRCHSAMTGKVIGIARTVGRERVEEIDIPTLTWIPWRNIGTLGSFDDHTRRGLIRRVSSDEATMLTMALKGERAQEPNLSTLVDKPGLNWVAINRPYQVRKALALYDGRTLKGHVEWSDSTSNMALFIEGMPRINPSKADLVGPSDVITTALRARFGVDLPMSPGPATLAPLSPAISQFVNFVMDEDSCQPCNEHRAACAHCSGVHVWDGASFGHYYHPGGTVRMDLTSVVDAQEPLPTEEVEAAELRVGDRVVGLSRGPYKVIRPPTPLQSPTEKGYRAGTVIVDMRWERMPTMPAFLVYQPGKLARRETGAPVSK